MPKANPQKHEHGGNEASHPETQGWDPQGCTTMFHKARKQTKPTKQTKRGRCTSQLSAAGQKTHFHPASSLTHFPLRKNDSRAQRVEPFFKKQKSFTNQYL